MLPDRASTSRADAHLAMPSSVVMVDGTRFDVPDGPVWSFGANVRKLNVGHYDYTAGRTAGTVKRPTVFAPALTLLMRCFLLDQMQQVSPNGLQNYHNGFVQFEDWLHSSGGWADRPRSFGLGDITVATYDAFRMWSHDNASAKGAHCRALRRLYKWAEGQPGYSSTTYAGIKRLELQKAVAGKATRLRDPLRGPFDQWEQEQFTQALADERGGPDYAVHRALIGVFRELGVRPFALSLMSRRHLRRIMHPGGASQFIVDVPRIKQRGKGLTYDETYRMEITSRLGHALLALHTEKGDPDAPLIPLRDVQYTTSEMRKMMSEWAAVANLLTNRVPPADAVAGSTPPYPMQPLAVFPQRFRRTLATSLAEQGYTADAIAAFLDDKSLAMAVIYTENSAAMVQLLSDTLDKHPDWLRHLRMFRGEIPLVADESLPEVLGGAPWLADYAEFATMGTLGRCAAVLPCEYRPPLTCYLCTYFRPDPRGPHELQLTQIRREASQRLGRTSDRLLGVLKRVDGAVAQVIAKCAEINAAAASTPSARMRATLTAPAAPPSVTQPGGDPHAPPDDLFQ